MRIKSGHLFVAVIISLICVTSSTSRLFSAPVISTSYTKPATTSTRSLPKSNLYKTTSAAKPGSVRTSTRSLPKSNLYKTTSAAKLGSVKTSTSSLSKNRTYKTTSASSKTSNSQPQSSYNYGWVYDSITIVKPAPTSESVPHAEYADSAGRADSAEHADSAEYADSAEHAKTADTLSNGLCQQGDILVKGETAWECVNMADEFYDVVSDIVSDDGSLEKTLIAYTGNGILIEKNYGFPEYDSPFYRVEGHTDGRDLWIDIQMSNFPGMGDYIYLEGFADGGKGSYIFKWTYDHNDHSHNNEIFYDQENFVYGSPVAKVNISRLRPGQNHFKLEVKDMAGNTASANVFIEVY